MLTNRLGVLVLFLLLCGGAARADVIPGGHFSIDLADTACPTQLVSDCSNSTGGWGNGQGFTAMANQVFDTTTFQNNVVCSEDSENPCHPPFDGPEDPTIRINPDGNSLPVGGTFTFSANSNGGGFLTFFNNTDGTFSNFLITTPLIGDKFYSCDALPHLDGGPSFTNCGFRIDPNTGVLDIAFWDTVPEPALGLFLIPAVALIMVVHKTRLKRLG
jgi:hypothetical protein